jgi:outer membrane protein assembly factor BamD (BamD/ComL family)
MARRLLLILGWLALLAGGRAQPETSLFAPVPLAPTPVATGALIVGEESARRALALGFTATAAAQAEKLAVEAPEGSVARDAAALIAAAARLELGDGVAAERALGWHGAERPAAYRLRAGLLAARQGRIAAAQAEAAAIRVEALPAEERAWFYLLQGMLAEEARDAGRAGAAYDQAMAVATSEWQRARLRLARERLRIEQGEVTESQANSLREQAERYAGRGLAADFAAQYAVALNLLGRKDAAVSYLQAQIAALPDGLAGSRDDLRLVLGLIAGPEQGAGRAALEQLLAGGTDAAKQRMALQLLAAVTGTAEVRLRLRRTLDELLMRTPPHVLTEELLLARSELALVVQDYGQAEADARDLLARFPASGQRARALTQMASVAWELKRFRTAADFAAQAAGVADDAQARATLRLLAAEASYRAQDYTAAAEAYAVAAQTPPAGVTAAAAMFQEIMARIADVKLDDAAATLDRYAGDGRFDAMTRWQAEWNLARAFQAAGRRDVALERVGRLRAEPESAARPAELRARLGWLEARLAQESGRPEEALRFARAVPASLTDVEPTLAREIAGLARLVEAEALFSLSRGEEAMLALRELRKDEPGTEATLQSFLVEADYQAAAGGLVEAQGLLTTFVDEHRDHPYAPYALFQAAVHAERRGEDVFYREAYLLLERLVQDYPASVQVFGARMKQGDLLRRMNQFPQAQQIYESLVNNYAQNPAVLSAQMALADCHRAQAAQDSSHFDSAITLLERLRDLADAPADIRAEAGYKLGDILAGRDPEAALAAWWPVADTLLLDVARARALGAEGRYWLGRLLVRMAGLLEQAGRADEAREAWRLLVARGLPGAALAKGRLEAGAGVATGAEAAK